jgi:hypothetical protein
MLDVRRLFGEVAMTSDCNDHELDRLDSMARCYVEGIYTAAEIAAQALVVAGTTPPEVVLDRLPATAVEVLREQASRTLCPPDEYVFIASWCGSLVDSELYAPTERRRAELAYAGLARLHDYFDSTPDC